MEIRQLVYFINACRFKNFTKAAEACGVVQTAITHQISALEKELNAKLFIRGKRGVELTPAGQVFYKEAKALVEQSERARQRVTEAAKGRQQTLCLGYSGQLLRGDLPILLDRFRREHPEMAVKLEQGTTEHLIEKLESKVLDCLIVQHFDFYRLLDWMEVRTILEDTLTLVVAKDHPFAGAKSVTLSDLQSLNVILYWEKGMRENVLRHAQKGTPMNVSAVTSSSDTVGILVEAGYGVAITMSSQAVHIRSPRVAFIPFEDRSVRTKLELLHRKDGVEPPLACFLDLMDQYDFAAHEFGNKKYDLIL